MASPNYDPAKVDLTPEQHADAKEVDDVINAIVDGEGDKAQEAIEAVFVLMDNILDPAQRFEHLFKVLSGVMSNQVQVRLLPGVPE